MMTQLISTANNKHSYINCHSLEQGRSPAILLPKMSSHCELVSISETVSRKFTGQDIV